MSKIQTWKADCRICSAPAYYYPAKLLSETNIFYSDEDILEKRLVNCSCSGEIDGTRHSLKYSFPKDFEKLD